MKKRWFFKAMVKKNSTESCRGGNRCILCLAVFFIPPGFVWFTSTHMLTHPVHQGLSVQHAMTFEHGPPLVRDEEVADEKSAPRRDLRPVPSVDEAKNSKATENEAEKEAAQKADRAAYDLVVEKAERAAADKAEAETAQRAVAAKAAAMKAARDEAAADKVTMEAAADKIADPEKKAAARADAVRDAIKHFWKGYKETAFGADEVRPINGGAGGSWGSLGMTILDSLDTIWLAGLKEEFLEGEEFVAKLNFDMSAGRVSFFETTIRALAGLLSSYALSKHKVFLDKARDIGDRLLQAFFHGGVWAAAYISLRDRSDVEKAPSWRRNSVALSDIGSNVMEFAYLSEATGDPKYKDAAEANMRKIMGLGRPLAPMFLNVDSKSFAGGTVSMAAYSDSYFEYLLKMYVLTGKRERIYLDTWKAAMAEMRDVLIRKSPDGFTYVSNSGESGMKGSGETRMDHLSCFMGGNLALGSYLIPEKDAESWWLPTAHEITKTCYELYRRSPTGLTPEVNSFAGSSPMPLERQYRLRPETLESIYYMYRVTGDETYRDWSWNIFKAIDKVARVRYGFAKVQNTQIAPKPPLEDSQETFMGAETLKYALLIHLPAEVLPLDKFVFNTEAHPFPVFNSRDTL